MAISDIKTVWKPVKAWVTPVVAEICTTRRIYFVWGKSSGTSGEHPLGRALDFSILEYGKGVSHPGPARPALGNQIAAYFLKHRTRLNVYYVIWNRRIASAKSRPAWSWRPYSGESPHTDHVHVSFNASGVYHPPKDKDDMPLTAAEKNEIAKLAADRVWSWDHIRNTSVTDPKDAAYTWTPATFLSHLEATQDQQGAQLAEIRKVLATILTKLQP